MKFLFIQGVLFLFSVTLLLYLFSLEYFIPISDGIINLYNVSTVLILLFILSQSLVSLIIFLIQKFLAFRWSDFPHHGVTLKWGLIISGSFIVGLILHIMGILIFPWSFLALLLVIIILTVI